MTRRGVILPVVLFILVLLGLLCAMFAFRVNADLAATQAVASRLQTRLAAEAGIERVKLLLRTARHDMDRWYHNPDELHRIIVWAHDTDPTIWGTDEKLEEGAMAYRFSIVADDPTDDEEYIRIGVTDEASKLNLNEAAPEQLMTLVRAAVAGDEEINPRDIVAAILDWRDADENPLSEAGDTERDYYLELDKPYRVKNGPFDTVEELLLVKGVTGQILYGEDFDRNGLLTDNEDDGDESFPPDDEDGTLNRGLYPYLTVHSYEDNVSNDNHPRVYLFGNENTVREQLAMVFKDEPQVVDYIVEVTRGQGGGRQRSPGPGGGDDSTGKPGEGTGSVGPGGDDSTEKGGGTDDIKAGTRRQVSEEGSDGTAESVEPDEEEPIEEGSGEPGDADMAPEDEGETDDAGSALGPIRSPAGLLLPRSIRGEIRPGPVGPEHLAALMDRTTTEPPEKRKLPGLININTAPPLVLRCIEELTGEQIGAILDTRSSLDAQKKATTAWLVTEEVLDLETYISIAGKITARGQQFTIDSLGYSDHMGMVSRLQVVVDMVGPIAQTIYYRDLSYIGGHFPIREEDREKARAR